MINKISIIAVGKIKEKYLVEGINEFLKRLKPFCKIEMIELKDEGIEKESLKIENYIAQNSYVLDATSNQFSSEEFADFFKKQEGEIKLIIGGPEGIKQEVKQKAKLISLSKMTFTHEITRLVLLEQIYRSYMIINNRSYYHK
jgi:23S rRNA (pseudouridine1915-N3)-methyltransferase